MALDENEFKPVCVLSSISGAGLILNVLYDGYVLNMVWMGIYGGLTAQ